MIFFVYEFDVEGKYLIFIIVLKEDSYDWYAKWRLAYPRVINIKIYRILKLFKKSHN